ncbi:hypothetical protein J2Z60_000585 [Lactobacillus colini]|uniref:DUF1659 domain-containing protein n=1 Tax=Lactobacillus colini TaxID=1819254 RepID=A0ABS4MDK4_9LACO|nr:DUF1659 domain-containing protein [Lactobacillus colini]MBP2057421.1 hypothetical protein [Lactobacillus colini]
MNNLIEQNIQFTFSGDNYKDGKMSRIYKNVRRDAAASDLVKVGKAISSLQKDKGLVEAILIQKSAVDLSAE